MTKRVFLTLSLFLCSFLGFGWGFFGHKIITQLAIYGLPRQMQPFYYRHQENLVEHSVRPDQRRNQDPQEAPRHFIDLDVYGDGVNDQLPQAWEEALKVYPADTLRKYGIVPWHVVRLKERLTEAFRSGNADSILFYSADIGHYIADAHVPLHTSVNYDGQLTGQRGIHALWESRLPELFIQDYQLYSGKASYLPDPQGAIWEVVRSTFTLLEPTLHEEREATQAFSQEEKYVQVEVRGQSRQYYADAFAAEYQKRMGDMVERQMQASARMVASFWYSCWVDAGKPDLNKLLATPLTKQERNALKKETEAWRKNELLRKEMLLAKNKK
jgi:hypothetical protein